MIPHWMTAPNPEIYLSDNYVVMDIETTNLNKGDPLDPANKLLMTGYGKSGKVSIFSGNEYEAGWFVDYLKEFDYVVAHNAKFELGWLKRMGADLHSLLIADTMLGEYVIAGNRKFKLGLGDTASRYGYKSKEPYIDLCMKHGICPSELPQSMLRDRNIYDVTVTDLIWRKQRERLHKNGLLPCFFTRCIFTPCLADIESNGMQLDEERVNEEYRNELESYNTLTDELALITGGINTRSNKQMAEFLYDTLGFDEPTKRGGEPDRTASGQRRTDSQTINSLKSRNKKQREFKDLLGRQAKSNSRLTKALNNFKECCDDNQGLLYGKFNQSVTATHRLSSSGRNYGVQFQNLPREYKKLFKARNPSWLQAEIDGAQLEFRVAAHLGNDPRATEDIRNAVDVHVFTADTLTAAGQETDRQAAKAHTFKPLYGGQSGTKAEKAYYTAFKEKYKGIASAQQEWVLVAAGTKKYVAQTGLVFYYPKAQHSRSGYVDGTTQICNYPVQNLATAEIIPIAVTHLWHSIKAMQSFLVNTVHDSAIAELHPEEVEEFRKIAEDSFTNYVYFYLNKVYDIQFTVPLGTGFKASSHWGEGAEITSSVEPPTTGSNND